METRYLNVEFVTTIPIRITVPDGITDAELNRLATASAWDEIHNIESRDGLGTWVIPSGTIEPISDEEAQLIWGDEV